MNRRADRVKLITKLERVRVSVVITNAVNRVNHGPPLYKCCTHSHLLRQVPKREAVRKKDLIKKIESDHQNFLIC